MTDDPPNLRPEAFAGTALAYTQFRPPYPRPLLDALVAGAEPADQPRLLDLACGPGRVALAIADCFVETWAVDLEPEMVDLGRLEAARRGIETVRWSIGRAEDLVAPAASFDLITIGEAFHRLDQPRVAALARLWLKPGGCLATLGCEGLLNGREPWQRAVSALARRWTRKAFPGGWAPARPGAEGGLDRQMAVLREAGFQTVASYSFAQPHNWTIESIIGYLRSTSVCSARILGDDAPAFDAALTAELLALDGGGIYREQLTFGYTLARNPA